MNNNLSDYTKTSSTLNWGYKYFKKKPIKWWITIKNKPSCVFSFFYDEKLSCDARHQLSDKNNFAAYCTWPAGSLSKSKCDNKILWPIIKKKTLIEERLASWMRRFLEINLSAFNFRKDSVVEWQRAFKRLLSQGLSKQKCLPSFITFFFRGRCETCHLYLMDFFLN